MRLSLQEVSWDDEFKEIVHCERTAYETPYNGVFTLFCPVIGNHESARAEALEEAENRQRQWHKSDPTSHWIKVVDEDNGDKVAGAALWHIYEASPYAKPPEHEMTCYWWPEGPKRAMADQAMGQMVGPRIERMNKPHLRTLKCFVRLFQRLLVGCLISYLSLRYYLSWNSRLPPRQMRRYNLLI